MSKQDNYNPLTINKPVTIKQERTTDERSETPSDSSEMGAAGLWAKNQNHSSFADDQLININEETEPREKKIKIENQLTIPASGYLTNPEDFVCSICYNFVKVGDGVALRRCRHQFCHPCLINAVEVNASLHVLCPMKITKCGDEVLHTEIRSLLKKDAYDKFIGLINQSVQSRHTMSSRKSLLELEELENVVYVENRSKFDCPICLTEIKIGDGIVLKNCLHEYCKICLARTIETSDEVIVPCPFVAEDGIHCAGTIQDLEMRYLVAPEVYEAHLQKSLTRAEAIIKDSFHCQTPNCPAWVELAGAQKFHCVVCKKENCVKCKAVHENKTCEEYYYETNADARKSRDIRLTETKIRSLVSSKTAMPCPGCGIIIQKNQGCNHMKCTQCKLDFQWFGLQ
ncbi:CLUMA_CG000646, isoform B [Clunio marinus]|uniref:CLUMA_CG000646, isoform B n=2 Tax=Clunio marinus TaxID=568069 RepID=A0A1J1HFP4_9DIPT|nr:CLUMA_CG000646, isoform B [Clunio marinus]